MGLDSFRRILGEPRFAGVPMILETPKGIEDGKPLDLINLRVLRELEQGPSATKRARRKNEKERRES
jgi:deoxyribonuclease-4